MFFTTLKREKRGTFFPRHLTSLWQSLQEAEGWTSNSARSETAHLQTSELNAIEEDALTLCLFRKGVIFPGKFSSRFCDNPKPQSVKNPRYFVTGPPQVVSSGRKELLLKSFTGVCSQPLALFFLAFFRVALPVLSRRCLLSERLSLTLGIGLCHLCRF